MDELTNMSNSQANCHLGAQYVEPPSGAGQNPQRSINPLDFSLQSLAQDDFEKADSQSLAFLRDSLSASSVKRSLPKLDQVTNRLAKTIIRKVTGKKSVEILRVSNICQLDTKNFHRGWVNPPVKGDEFIGSNITIGGWLIGKNAQPTIVRVVVSQTTIAEIPINLPRPDVVKAFFVAHVNCGFSTILDTTSFPSQAELILQAVFPDGCTAVAGSILLRRYG